MALIPTTQPKNNLCELSTSNKKTAHILAASISKLGNDYGIEKLGMLTLTFKQNVTCAKEAQRRFNSLVSNVIKPRYREYLGVFERQKSGRIHYHLIVVLNEDVRTGLDFSALKNRDYKTANHYLRSEWSFWRKTAPKYNFGRTELLPVKSTLDSISKYVGKYISKNLIARGVRGEIEKEKYPDRGVRLVRYSNGARAGNNRFMFVTPGSLAWRIKVAKFANILSQDLEGLEVTEDNLSLLAGKQWAFKNREFILSLPLIDVPAE